MIRNPPPPEERNYLLCALKSEMLAARCHGHTGLFTAWAFPGPEASSVATQSTAFTTSSAGEPGRLWGPRTQARPPSPISSGNRFQAGVWTNGTQRSAEAGAPPGRFCSAWRSWIENHHDTVTDGRHPGARLRQRGGLRCPLRCVPSGFTPKATPPPEKQPRSPFSPNFPGSVGFAGLTPLPRRKGPWGLGSGSKVTTTARPFLATTAKDNAPRAPPQAGSGTRQAVGPVFPAGCDPLRPRPSPAQHPTHGRTRTGTREMALSGGGAPLGGGRLAERQPETCSDFAGNVLSTESHHLKISLRLGGGGSFTSLEMLVTESRICSKASPLAPSRREKENAAFGQVPNMGPSRGAREAVLKRLDPGALGEGLKGRGRGEGCSHPPPASAQP